MGYRQDKAVTAYEHNEKRMREILDNSRANQRNRFKESDFPSGEEMAPSVYRQGQMIIVGDKY